jgi:hypothetical protein
MLTSPRHWALLALALLLAAPVGAQPADAPAPQTYRVPAPHLLDIMDAPAAPFARITSNQRWLVITERDLDFTHVPNIKEPLLLIHGMRDSNTGTFPVQTERLFAALQGAGGNARYVQLPLEDHGYMARESRRHVLWEMVTWLDEHVKNAKPVVQAAKH